MKIKSRPSAAQRQAIAWVSASIGGNPVSGRIRPDTTVGDMMAKGFAVNQSRLPSFRRHLSRFQLAALQTAFQTVAAISEQARERVIGEIQQFNADGDLSW